MFISDHDKLSSLDFQLAKDSVKILIFLDLK